jgi:peptide/nickel transport system ATP-binding protein
MTATMPLPAGASPVLSVRDLMVHFASGGGLFQPPRRVVRSVDGVSFDLMPGETLALVGESGCGKTTTGRALLRIVDPTSGQIDFRTGDGTLRPVRGMDRTALTAYRRDVRMVFQDPVASLNPRLPVSEIVAEPLRNAGGLTDAAIRDRVAGLLARVGLGREVMDRYPHAFSGGQRQRIGIARALAPGPRVLIADEALSALDVSVQAQTINLMLDLQAELGLAYLFISHDLTVVRHIADRVAVMYLGRIVEIAPAAELFEARRHPYTRALIAAAPRPDPRLRDVARVRLPGELPDPAAVPAGCTFAPRCPLVDAQCRSERPALRPIGRALVACHKAEH